MHDAIQRKYLKELHFGISSDPHGEDLLEEYVYQFAFDGNKVQMSAKDAKISLMQSSKASCHACSEQQSCKALAR